MPKQTLALIIGLVVITFVLFVVALKTSRPVPSPEQAVPTQAMTQGDGTTGTMTSTAAPVVPMHSVLNLSPNPVSVGVGQAGSVDVNIDTSDNQVTAVQLEIAYDPNFISNVKVEPSGLFTNPVVLIDRNAIKDGRYTFAFGITPNHAPVQGTGIVATITFTAANKTGQDTQLALLPSTLVTARGISNSVLKTAQGAIVHIQ